VSEYNWLSADIALAIHHEQLVEHGGGAGVRDEGALLSALGRPQNLAAYGEPDGAALAAAYASAVARNHPFVDGNKRTAWVLARLFLARNGIELEFNQAEAVIHMMALASGELTEDELAEWFRKHVRQS
jgi:death-on-curing protein